ncbi:uncharacterized protein UDID_06699 [Ustilago sp. UG-2017a]|nr:uncharacterized protein UDID_06699 [Ustilago sp. UG-2017a]
MILRPSPGRLRAMARSAGRHAPPRSSNTIRPSVPRTIHTAARPSVRRGFSTSSIRPLASPHSISALLKRTLIRATRSLQITLNRPVTPFKLHPILTTLKEALRRPSYTVRSSLLKGAISTFRSTASRTTPSTTKHAYSLLNTPSVTLARGALSGLGPRPSAGQLSLSPLRGGVGLQTSRKFSSGGARVFDNLVVNAPLALRLVGDELEEKSKLARRKPSATVRRAGPVSARRTGAAFTGAKLAKNAFSFANQQKQQQAIPQSKVVEADYGKSEVPSEYSEYFQYPSLTIHNSTLASVSSTTVIRIRLIHPLYDALGGRDPSPSTLAYGPRLFDQAFLLDASTALEYEHKRYLQAKTLLRVLWQSGVLTEENGELDLASDPAYWTISVRGRGREEVERVLRRAVQFDFAAWCSIGSEGGEEERAGGLDWSYLHPGTTRSEGWLTPTTSRIERGEEVFSLPSTPTLSSGEEVGQGEAEVGSDELMSLPSDVSFSSGAGLSDSREWL